MNLYPERQPVSRVSELQRRIDNIMMACGICPTVLDIHPDHWDDLMQEMLHDRRSQGMQSFEYWSQSGKVRLVKGLY